jgi:hypothetical protein
MKGPNRDSAGRFLPKQTSRCSDPQHALNRAHGVSGRCVICDPAPTIPPLTFRQWSDGEGGELQRNRFVADYNALVDGKKTPEIVERMRAAFAGVS